MDYSIYDLATGEFKGNMAIPPEWLTANTPSGCGVIEGTWSGTTHRVDVVTGDVVTNTPATPTLAELKAGYVASVNDWVRRWVAAQSADIAIAQATGATTAIYTTIQNFKNAADSGIADINAATSAGLVDAAYLECIEAMTLIAESA